MLMSVKTKRHSQQKKRKKKNDKNLLLLHKTIPRSLALEFMLYTN